MSPSAIDANGVWHAGVYAPDGGSCLAILISIGLSGDRSLASPLTLLIELFHNIKYHANYRYCFFSATA